MSDIDNGQSTQIQGAETSTADVDAYLEQMANKADEGLDTTGQSNLLAGKYKTEDDLNQGILEVLRAQHGGNLEAAYASLAKDLGNGFNADEDGQDGEGEDASDAEDNQDSKDNSDEDPEDNSEDNSDETPSNDELMSSAEEEYAENGELSAETYEQLQKAFNVSKDMIDQFIDGQLAQAERAANQVYDMVGGEEAFNHMREWAGANLNKSQIAMFNEDVTSGNTDRIERAVEMCNSAYRKAMGMPGNDFLNGDRAVSTAVTGYTSKAEMTADMKDPRYQAGDAAFHAMVQQRLKNARFYG